MNTKNTTTQVKKNQKNLLAKYAGKPADTALALKIARDAIKQAGRNSPLAKVRTFSERDENKMRDHIVSAFKKFDGICIQNDFLHGKKESVTIVSRYTDCGFDLGYTHSGYRYAGDVLEIELICKDKFYPSVSGKTLMHKREVVINYVRANRF